MFEIAWSELLLVIVVAIVVVGPKELPGLLRTIGRVMGKLRRSADEFRRQFEDTIRDTGAEDIQREINQLRYNNPLTDIRNTLEEAARDADRAVQPPALEAPTGETPPAAGDAAAHTAAPPADAAAGANGSGSEPRINGEHRPAN